MIVFHTSGERACTNDLFPYFSLDKNDLMMYNVDMKIKTKHAEGTFKAPKFTAYVGAPSIPFVCDHCASDAVVEIEEHGFSVSMLCQAHHKEFLLRRKD